MAKRGGLGKFSRKDVMDAVLGVVEAGARCAVVFVKPRKGVVPKLRVKATRIHVGSRAIELRVTIGRPAYAEREKCKQWIRAGQVPHRFWARK